VRCLVVLLAVGCGEVHFVDPNPPELFRTTAHIQAGLVDEPVVWMTILDLFVEDAGGCAAAKQATLDAVRAAFATAGGAQMELPFQDLSPDCQKRAEVPLDVAAVKAAFATADATFPQAHVRPVLVYLDDIDLPLPAQVSSALQSLHATSVAGGATRPILWTVTFPSASNKLGSDSVFAWTFTGDPALQQNLAAMVESNLPLRSTTQPGPVPLLGSADLETTQELKLCDPPDGFKLVDNIPVGQAVQLDRANPPRVLLNLPPIFFDQMRASQLIPAVDITVERCTGNCHRFYIGQPGDAPRRWDEIDGCVLGDPQ